MERSAQFVNKKKILWLIFLTVFFSNFNGFNIFKVRLIFILKVNKFFIFKNLTIFLFSNFQRLYLNS